MLIFGVSGSCIYVWDADSGQILYNLEGRFENACVVSNDFLLATAGDPSLLVYRWRQGKILHRSFVSDRSLTSFTISPAKTHVVAGNTDGKFLLWLLETGHLLSATKAHHGSVTCLNVTEDNIAVISGGQDGVVKVYFLAKLCSTQGSHQYCSFAQHCAPITALHTGTRGFSGRLFTSSLDQTVNIYSLSGKSHIHSISFQTCITKLILTIDERFLFVGCTDGSIGRFDLIKEPKPKSLEMLKQRNSILRSHDAKITGLALSVDGVHLFSCSEDAHVVRWNVWEGTPVGTLSSKAEKLKQIICPYLEASSKSFNPPKFGKIFKPIEAITAKIAKPSNVDAFEKHMANLKRRLQQTKAKKRQKVS